MILHSERWMDLRRFRALHEAGLSISAIARETGLNWRTVKKYVEAPPPVVPPKGPSRKGCHRQVIEPFKPVIGFVHVWRQHLCMRFGGSW
ncbi:hypothetical protein ACFU5O_32060 [Streptomyces sp. NPDC057445]|uniref:hypothetical protein n=1 Tax=Streptomyces sp. NPDC057445 TaxID=3346136 RepID=UPI003699F4E0